MAGAEELKIRDYLLRRLSEPEEQQVELRLLNDPDFAEEYDIVEREIIDDYISGKFAAEDRRMIEEHYFNSDERRAKLKFALALKRRKSELAISQKTARRSYKPYLAIAASLLLVVGGFVVWRTLTANKEVDKGLAALQSAFRQERPFESRISRLDYAPYVVTRGPGEHKVDQNELDRAELTLLQALKDRPTPAAHHALGKVFLAKKDFDKAIEEFETAATNDSKNPLLFSDLGAAWLEKGKIDLEKGKADPASGLAGKGMEELGRSLQNLNKALELNPDLLEALFNRALCEQQLKLSSQAETDYREYLRRDSTSPWAEEARRNLQALTESRQSDGGRQKELFERFVKSYHDRDAARAWQAIRQSRSRSGNRIAERLLDQYLEAIAQNNNDAAAENFRMLSFASTLESQQVGDQYTADLASFYAHANRNRCLRLRETRAIVADANRQYDKSEFEAAITLYKQAVQAFAREGDTCEALANESWIGYCELRLADRNSRERFERLAASFQSRRYKSLLAQALHAESDSETTGNEFSKVLQLAGAGLQQADAIHDDVTRLRCLQQFVSVNRQLGNYHESLKYGLQALLIPQLASLDPKLVWTFYHELAMDFYWLKMPVVALRVEEEALRLAQQANWPFIIVRSYTQLGIILEQQSRYDEAIQNGRLAIAEGQKIAGEKARLNVVSHALMRLGHLYRNSGDLINAIASYEQALRMFEELQLGMFLYEAHKGKFMALAASGKTTEAELELAQTLQLFEQYRTKIQEEKSRDSFFDADQDTYDMAIDFAYTTQGDMRRAFDYAERTRARSLLSLTSKSLTLDRFRATQADESSPRSVEQIQNGLPAGAQVVQYSVLNDKVIAWVVSHEDLRSSSLAIDEKSLQQKIDDYQGLISRAAPLAQISQAAQDLDSLLIRPIESYLDPRKELCIVPDKALTTLPFASLVSASDGKFLVERFRLIFSASTNVFINASLTAAKKANRSTETVLSVGNPSFSHQQFPNLPDLPAASDEARQIAAYYNAEPMTDAAAKEDRIRVAMARADVVHFAAHYIINQDHPEFSALVLAQPRTTAPPSGSDGLLQASEIEQLNFPRTRLVVLSACQTGIERTYRGEGAISLARSFIAAGVPLAIASLWPIESEAAGDLMIRFHRYRKLDKLSTVDALRSAQLEMLKLPDEKSHQPLNWASFQVFGGYANF
jgi:CHAT domain-containing protein